MKTNQACGHLTCCGCGKCGRCFACCVTSENPCEPDYDFHTLELARKYIHFSFVEDDVVGFCWAGDHAPEPPLGVTHDTSKVTCEFCKEHIATLNDLSKALPVAAVNAYRNNK